MLAEINGELLAHCEEAANEIVNRILEAMDDAAIPDGKETAFVIDRLQQLSKAERFALDAYVMEMVGQVPLEDEESPQETPLPSDEELADYIVGFWEEMN